ncbi:MAG: hypothetical protein H7Y06_04280 [Opitutaceae bacterium]|nr:hypothetical protein [Opitutaceae bacterium]
MAGGWDDNVLSFYFKVRCPLYATQIYIPEIKADAAPNAFGVGDIVKSSRWMIHYRGQVTADPQQTTHLTDPAIKTRLCTRACDAPSSNLSVSICRKNPGGVRFYLQLHII